MRVVLDTNVNGRLDAGDTLVIDEHTQRLDSADVRSLRDAFTFGPAQPGPTNPSLASWALRAPTAPSATDRPRNRALDLLTMDRAKLPGRFGRALLRDFQSLTPNLRALVVERVGAREMGAILSAEVRRVMHNPKSHFSDEVLQTTEDILSAIEQSARPAYYAEKLVWAFLNPMRGAITRRDIAASTDVSTLEVDEGYGRMSPEERRTYEQREERRHAEVRDHLEFIDSFYWGYHIDRRDPANLFATVRIMLTSQTPGDVRIEKTKRLEDAIEKHLSIPGLTVDVQFVDDADGDAFQVRVDDVANGRDIITMATWAGGTYQQYAHEVGHMLDLDDEYSFADDVRMDILNTFRQRIDANEDLPAQWFGVMSSATGRPLHRHACEMAYDAPSTIESCVALRESVLGPIEGDELPEWQPLQSDREELIWRRMTAPADRS